VLIIMIPAVGGIIAAISIPAYNDYTVRAQVSEGLNLAGGAKAAVTEYYQDRGELPADNATAGLTPAEQIQGKYVSRVKVHDGVIVVTYGNDADSDLFGRQLLLQPELADGYVRWNCHSLDIEPKDLPAACRP